MIVGACTLRLHLAGCMSLKSKRSRLKPLLARLRREFNVAVAEVGLQAVWQSADIAIVTVANETARVETQLDQVVKWIEHAWPELEVVEAQVELR
jgi:uncharacterized protein YlxP (DUF503 family)